MNRRELSKKFRRGEISWERSSISAILRTLSSVGFVLRNARCIGALRKAYVRPTKSKRITSNALKMDKRSEKLPDMSLALI